MNTLFSYLAQFWSKVLGLILLPVIVRGLGEASYGLYALVIVVIGYYALLDLGISSAVTKYVSEHNARGEYDSINRLASSSLQAHVLLGVIGSLLIVILAKFLLPTLDVPEGLLRTARIVVYVSAVQFLVNISGSVFSGILSGLQRIDLLNKISILSNTATISTTALLAALGFGLVPIVILNLFWNLATIAANAFWAKRALPSLRINFGSCDLGYLRRIISFGVWTFVIQAGTIIHFTTDRLLIGFLLPISFVTYYVVAVKLAEIIRSVPMPVVGVLFPAVSDLKAKGEVSAISEILLRGTRYVLSMSIPISVFLFLFSRQILAIWMGPEYGQSSGLVLMLFASAYLVNTLTFVNTSVLFGLGIHRLMAIYCVASSAINLGLDLILIPRMGIHGAAAASLAAFLATNPALVVHSGRALGVSVREILRAIRPPVLSGVLAGLAGYLLLRVFHPTGWTGLILSAVSLLVVYYGSLALGGGFDERDRAVLRKFMEVALRSTPLRALVGHR